MSRRAQLLGGGGALVAALALFFLSPGCGEVDGFDAGALYPLRTDPLVLDLSRADPPKGVHAVGKWNESIGHLTTSGGRILIPGKLTPADRAAIARALDALFGSPAAPKVDVPDAAEHGLDSATLAAGSRVYRQSCLQCHGATGDGRGPTSLWVYPHARDFRQGQFKFVSTPDGRGWPTRDDLRRAVRRGIGGNSMPPFVLMDDADNDRAAAYTLHLMFRGLVEFDLIQECLKEEKPDIPEYARDRLNQWFRQWREAQNTAVTIPDLAITDPRDAESHQQYAAGVRRGHDLFLNQRLACTTCHTDYGRASPWRYDSWGTAVRPNNLTEGFHRGGGEAADLYRRLRAGIVSVGMPPVELNDAQLADLIAFLRALPDPRHLPPDVRRTVYPEVR